MCKPELSIFLFACMSQGVLNKLCLLTMYYYHLLQAYQKWVDIVNIWPFQYDERFNEVQTENKG